MTARRNRIGVAAVFTLLATWASPAHAYLDPGTGSMILQAIIGAVAGALVVLRVYWTRVKLFFSAKNPDTPLEDGTQDHH